MKIKDIISHFSPKIKKTSSSPILDIELLLTKVLNKPKEYLYEYPEKKLTARQFAKFKKLFNRRLKNEPIAYLLGHKEFYNLNLKVNKNVLIPRPETELLVESVINFCKTKTPKLYNAKTLIIEIGTGSGAIIIALAKNLKTQFFATEISASALKVAKQNAKTHKVKIKFLKGNLLEPIAKSHNSNLLPSHLVLRQAGIIHNSIIVANLPYLTAQELKNPTIRKEPKLALNGGPDGLKYFRQLFAQIQKYNLKPKAIFLEIGFNQATKIKKLTRQILPKFKFQVKKDLCGHDRIIIITN
jgi:release factor glutamine methyltransferase